MSDEPSDRRAGCSLLGPGLLGARGPGRGGGASTRRAAAVVAGAAAACSELAGRGPRRPAAARGSVPARGTRCSLRDRCPRGPRDARARSGGAGPARRDADGHIATADTFRPDRTGRCVSQFPQPSLSNQLNFYILRRLIARRKKRKRGPRNALPNGSAWTHLPPGIGYAVWWKVR
jgi:hypothetical protein